MTHQSNTAAYKANVSDLLGLDHYPECPHCHNLCGRLAQRCFECGAMLYEVDPATGMRYRRPLTMQDASEAAREREGC